MALSFVRMLPRHKPQSTRVGRTAVASSKSLEDALRKTQGATDSRMKQTTEVAKLSAQQFTKFRNEVTALFATLATGFGFKTFLQNLANSDAALGRQATRLNMSVKDLDAWG